LTSHSLQLKRLAGFLLVLLLLIIVVVSFLFPPTDWIPAEKWGSSLENAGWQGVLLLILGGGLATSVGLPRQLVALIAGMGFGVLAGVLFSLVAAVMGCFITVHVSRKFFAVRIKQRFPKAIATLQSFVKHDVFIKILALRLQPLGTNLMTNICVGFTSVPLRVFLSASAIGYVPQLLVFALLGSGIRFNSRYQLVLSATMLLISFVLGFLVYRRHKDRTTAET